MVTLELLLKVYEAVSSTSCWK